MLRSAGWLSVLVLFGCYDAYETGDTPIVSPDAGGIVFPDSGRPDSSRPPPPPPPPPIDAGRPVCEELAPSSYEGPRCLVSTRDCIQDCDARGAGDDCFDACIFADPGCIDCLFGEVVECAVPTAGCQAEWDAFACCRDTRCRDGGIFECVQGACADAADRLFGCFDPVAAMCGAAQEGCF